MAHYGLKTHWNHPDRLCPRPVAGDIIEFKKNKENITHVGIADGKGGVYHFNEEEKTRVNLRSKVNKAHWEYGQIIDVSKGDHIRINNSKDHWKDHHLIGMELLKDTRRLSKWVWGNNRKKNNWHNVIDVGYDTEHRQPQVRSWTTNGFLTGAVIAAVIGVGAYASGANGGHGHQ